MTITRRDMRGKPEASMAGMEFYDIDFMDTISFCPDSNDASTPATQVHQIIKFKDRNIPMVARFHGTTSLDALIEALIEHRTYVFGRRAGWPNDFPEQT
jgi:hypothetical protein